MNYWLFDIQDPKDPRHQWDHKNSILSVSPYHMFMGTGLWSPPECNKREAFYPEGATVWSLGCLLHTMLSGDIPFKTKGNILAAKFDFSETTVNKKALDLIAG